MRSVRQGDVISPKLITNALGNMLMTLNWRRRGIIHGEYISHMRMIYEMYKEKWKLQLAVLLLATWLTATYMAIPPFRCGKRDISTDSEVAILREKLKSALLQLEAQRQRNIKLSKLLDRPPEEYEYFRRRIYSNIKELWYLLRHEIKRRRKSLDYDIELNKIFQDEINERKRSLLSDQERFPTLDGHEDWRRKEAASVSDLVQRRLRYLQHPTDCRAARKLVCAHDNCGFGCQLHHIVYCLIYAYATQRTLILNGRGWRYHNKGWEYAFHPVSDTCNTTYNEMWQFPVTHEAKVISLPALYYLKPKPKFLPLAIPEDLAHRIVRFNGDPVSWWIGQMVKYILKPRQHIQEAINKTVAKMNFKSPIVGVHIRRSDKVGTEAKFCELDDYMSQVDEYYAQLELTRAIDKRRVYLATDDPRVLRDARVKYPHYTFHGDPDIAKTAATRRRYTPLSLTGLLVDLHLLAKCDYFVCTFSSQFGRTVYEMMQHNRMDASTGVSSLDDHYHFVGQNPQHRIIIMNGDQDHNVFQVGDKINASGIRTGYSSKGEKTNKSAMIPWYKTADYFQLYPFPEYKQVPLHTNTTKNN